MVTSTFYAFEYNQGIVGLLFRNQLEADIMNIKIKSNSPKLAEFEEIKKRKVK